MTDLRDYHINRDVVVSAFGDDEVAELDGWPYKILVGGSYHCVVAFSYFIK